MFMILYLSILLVFCTQYSHKQKKKEKDTEGWRKKNKLDIWKSKRIITKDVVEYSSLLEYERRPMKSHNGDVIMSATASQITSLTIVNSTVCSGTDQRKHKSSALLAFVRGIDRWPVKYPQKGSVTRKKASIWWLHHMNGEYRYRLLSINSMKCQCVFRFQVRITWDTTDVNDKEKESKKRECRCIYGRSWYISKTIPIRFPCTMSTNSYHGLVSSDLKIKTMGIIRTK